MKLTTLRCFAFVAPLLVALSPLWGFTAARGAIIYESGTLGPTGQSQVSVPSTNVTQSVYTGVRFELTQPAVTEQVGGHFFGNGTFFGALVKLEGENDFPNSDDLSTPDVLGSAILAFPSTSAEVHGNLALSLDAGWYALVFGTGLFGSTGNGAAPRNNPDIGTPSYVAHTLSAGWTFPINPIFRNYRYVVVGELVPEPNSVLLIVTSLLVFQIIHRHKL